MKGKSYLELLFAGVMALSIISCSHNNPDPTPSPTAENFHFDVWTPIGGKSTSMGKDACVVKRTNTLESGELSFKGSGVDVSQKIYPSVIVKGKYYYHVSNEGRLGKYQITEDNIITVSEIPFSILKDRRYTHAWIDDNVLLLIGSNGDSDKILWAKINTETMTQIGSGELSLPTPPSGQMYNTSGMAAYRKSDNMLLYFFTYKKKGKTGTEPTPEFYASFINPSDMKTLKTVTETRAEQMASTARGELRHQKSFFDENGDYYLACNSVLPDERPADAAQRGALLRIKNKAMDFDKSYNAYTKERGRIVTMSYLDNAKALLLMQDPMHTTGNTLWLSKDNPYTFYWAIVDLKSLQLDELKDIPFGSGNYSQLSLVSEGKAYFAVNPKDDKSRIYVYDIGTGKITQGMTLADGAQVDRIIRIED